MGRAILIIGAGALAVGVIIYSLIECAQTEKYKVRSLPKGAWILLILLLPVIGAVLWLFFGRPKKADPGSQPQRGRGPDDDPQFLRNLEERRRQKEHQRRLQEWENELKRTGRPPGEKPQPLDPNDPRLSAEDVDDPAAPAEGTDAPEKNGEKQPGGNPAGDTPKNGGSTATDGETKDPKDPEDPQDPQDPDHGPEPDATPGPRA